MLMKLKEKVLERGHTNQTSASISYSFVLISVSRQENPN